MQRESPSWTQGWHRQNSVSGWGKVHKYMRTHGSVGATKPGRSGLGPVGPGRPAWPTSAVGSPPFLAPEEFSTLKPERRRHSQRREPLALGGHPQAREREERDLRRGIDHIEWSTHKWRRRKTLSEGRPWSTVLCLAPWWGNLLVRPWVVIGLEGVIVLYWIIYLSSCVECA
jgi:hypothetical protein